MMKQCEYVSVANDDDRIQDETPDEDDYRPWKPLVRQVLICSSVWNIFFQFGLSLGAPTVLISRMREERGEDYITRDMASWISSVMMVASFPWLLMIAYLSSDIGRRYTFAAGVATSLVGFALLSAGDTPQYVLIGMIVQGVLPALSSTITLLVLTEYTSPFYRGVFLTVKSASAYWGVWVANAIGTVSHWHYIAWLGLACGVYNAAVLFAWPESPYWLATKGRMEQCKAAHRWLQGHSKSSERQLKELIEGQQNRKKAVGCSGNIEKATFGQKWKQVCVDMKSKSFYRPLRLGFALIGFYVFTGKMVCSVYAIDIIKDITKSKSEAYKVMLILDGVTVLGMYIGCGLAKKLKRKTLLMSTGGAASVFLFIISVYLFLVRFEVMSESKSITISLLTCYSLSVGCGPIILNSTLLAELLPLRLRSTAATIMAIVSTLVTGVSLKVAPYIFTSLGMDGSFLLYGIGSSVFLVYLYIYLPETKDKTLEEIQDLILGIQTDINPEGTIKKHCFKSEELGTEK